jgi:hypothetical protein
MPSLDAPPPVEGVIETELARHGLTAVEQAVFGTGDAEGIAATVREFCRERLGEGPVGGLFYRASAGCVVGLRLASGTDVVLKAYQERWTAEFLTTVQLVQRAAGQGGLPCAQPLLPPAPLPGRSNLGMFETWLEDPGMQPLKTPAERLASAAGLAHQIAACAHVRGQGALAEHPLRSSETQLYPEPHSPLFDFSLDTASAQWIDELAREARRLRDGTVEELRPAHLDWSARNIRVGADGLSAVYDWDSVALATESTAIGQAAATWCVTSEPDGSDFPTREEIVLYIDAYEQSAERRLSDEQRRAAAAAAAWVFAYTARCEHSLEAAGMARPDQHGGRDRLAADGPALLELTRP